MVNPLRAIQNGPPNHDAAKLGGNEKMNRLLDIGFAYAGRWALTKEKGLEVSLMRHATQRNILYAFVTDGIVKYVGKTTRTLAERMAGYQRPARSQTTNINNNQRIRECLEAGTSVDILALPDSGLLHYGAFHINLAAGLEDDLIRTLAPEWNGGRAEAAKPAQEPELQLRGDGDGADAVSGPSVLGTFPLTLQPTYFRTGFFNVGVGHASELGADGDTIEIFLGNASKPVLGTINRRANNNGTPRIMGGPQVRDWFHSNCRGMDQLTVDVLSPVSIRIHVHAVA